MLSDLIKQAAYEQAEMDRLKAAGKEKTATYRQYFSNRLIYWIMVALPFLDPYAETWCITYQYMFFNVEIP